MDSRFRGKTQWQMFHWGRHRGTPKRPYKLIGSKPSPSIKSESWQSGLHIYMYIHIFPRSIEWFRFLYLMTWKLWKWNPQSACRENQNLANVPALLVKFLVAIRSGFFSLTYFNIQWIYRARIPSLFKEFFSVVTIDYWDMMIENVSMIFATLWGERPKTS